MPDGVAWCVKKVEGAVVEEVVGTEGADGEFLRFLESDLT
jgi:hypothetical protein